MNPLSTDAIDSLITRSTLAEVLRAVVAAQDSHYTKQDRADHKAACDFAATVRPGRRA